MNPASAAELPVPLQPVQAAQVLSGVPRAGAVVLGEFSGLEVGVWEHTPGASTDVEADELFVVLAGRATVRFLDEDRIVTLGPGSVVQLSAGLRTEWVVTETLRKVYLA